MIVIAQRQLRGAYGLVSPGDKFEPTDEVAKSLLQRGLVVEYEIKAIVPTEQPQQVPAAQPARRARRSNKSAQRIPSQD